VHKDTHFIDLKEQDSAEIERMLLS
jgi:hypothetical protein